MAEQPDKQPTPMGADNTDAEDAIAGEGGEGTRKAAATPPIADDGEPGQTQTPAEDES
jgi:hypothetical protein